MKSGCITAICLPPECVMFISCLYEVVLKLNELQLCMYWVEIESSSFH